MSHTEYGDTIVFSVRLPIDLALKVRKAADAANTNRNAWVVQLITDALRDQKRGASPGSPTRAGPGTSVPAEPPAGACAHPRAKAMHLVRCPDCGVKV